MELRVQMPSMAEILISFNHEELKEQITKEAANYENLIYTPEQVLKEGKADRAKLNKFIKALSDERIRVKKDYMKPLEVFEGKVKELEGIAKNAANNIDYQIKVAEEQRKEEKRGKIIELFGNTAFPDWVKLNMIFDARWLNSSVTLAAITKELIARNEQIQKDLSTLSNLPEFGFEAGEVYKTTLDVNRALNEGKRLSEIQKRKAEAERIAAERKAEAERMRAEAEAQKQQEEQLPGQIGFTDAESFEKNCIVPTTEEKPFEEVERQWVTFSGLLSYEDAMALRGFFESRKIEFKTV